MSDSNDNDVKIIVVRQNEIRLRIGNRDMGVKGCKQLLVEPLFDEFSLIEKGTPVGFVNYEWKGFKLPPGFNENTTLNVIYKNVDGCLRRCFLDNSSDTLSNTYERLKKNPFAWEVYQRSDRQIKVYILHFRPAQGFEEAIYKFTTKRIKSKLKTFKLENPDRIILDFDESSRFIKSPENIKKINKLISMNRKGLNDHLEKLKQEQAMPVLQEAHSYYKEHWLNEYNAYVDNLRGTLDQIMI